MKEIINEEFKNIIEKREANLNSLATKSYDEEATSRELDDYPNPYRTPFQRDRDRIIHSKAFRRLMHKTQVFVKPDSEHIRTRLTHTLEVMQIARSIARAIGANEDLTETISLGHDLGHTPFGHIGEEALNEELKKYGLFFKHNVQSYRIVNYLEKYYKFPDGGLNLTNAVKFGILRHSGEYSNREENVEVFDKEGNIEKIRFKQTLEEKIVRLADDTAWLNHDWEDGIRSGLLSNSFLGKELLLKLGATQADRINRMVIDVINNFNKTNQINFSVEIEKLEKELKSKIKNYLWNSDTIKRYNNEAKSIILKLFNFFMEHPDKLPDDTKRLRGLYINNKKKTALIIADYISGMTDDWCLRNYETYIYSPYNIYKKLIFPDEHEWLTIKKRNESEEYEINLPESMIIDVNTEFIIYDQSVKELIKNNKIEDLNKHELGECIYKRENFIEIKKIKVDKIIEEGNILIIK